LKFGPKLQKTRSRRKGRREGARLKEGGERMSLFYKKSKAWRRVLCGSFGVVTYKTYISALSTVSPAAGLETGPQYVPM